MATQLNSLEVGDHDDVKDLTEIVEDVSERLDAVAERRLVRKIDFRLIPILFLLYLCAFIDRYALF
jgi:hypothetical protein